MTSRLLDESSNFLIDESSNFLVIDAEPPPPPTTDSDVLLGQACL